jgi:hypothetical protein
MKGSLIRTNNALVQTFNVNDLNELSNVTRAGTLTVAGTTTSPATNVTINGSTNVANRYADATFALGGFGVTNGNNTFTAIANDSLGRWSTNSITVNLPATNVFAYDLNGNMLTNGNEVLVWNDENQLVTNYVAGSWKSEFVYDGKLRRRIERDYSWNGSAWVQTNEIHFIYDGNVIIQQRDANNLPTLTLTRGNDLSGSLQGAGGIGGLLAMTENALTINAQSSTSGHSYYHSDGVGNVTMLINGNQAVVAKAEFGPFGEFLSLSGSKAGVNPFWFSGKPIHWPSGKYDFLYRWYTPQLDRWPNGDPLKDQEFFKMALKGLSQQEFLRFWGSKRISVHLLDPFVLNSPINLVDAFGLQAVSTGVQACNNGIHGFIAIDGEGYGFYPKNNTILNELYGPGRVNSDSVADAKCQDLQVDPCHTDAKKFKDCVNYHIQQDLLHPPSYEAVFNNCREWRSTILNSCLATSDIETPE